MKKLTTEQWISRAKIVHGDTYDYSEVEYEKNSVKIKIICKTHGVFLQPPSDHEKKKYGCPTCSSRYPLSLDYFIEVSNRLHHNKYDYSFCLLKNNKTKVKIICAKHGCFEQTPSSHMNGNGCPICGGSKALTTELFIQRAKNIHGDRYLYNDVVYKNIQSKIKIECKIHGIWEASPNTHLKGYNCPKCTNSIKITSEFFIRKSKDIHNDYYQYDLSEYKNRDTPVKIVCPKHGEFFQTPRVHLRGNGCNLCSSEALSLKFRCTIGQFSQKANAIHNNNKYNYTNVVYTNNKTKTKILCSIHGLFQQEPAAHLSGAGCPKCSYQVSKPETEFLNYFGVLNNNDYRDIKIPKISQRYRVDGWVPELNLCIEFHGIWFHGSPRYYDSAAYNSQCKKTFGELYQRTLKKEKEIRDVGYNLLVIWEDEWNAMKKYPPQHPEDHFYIYKEWADKIKTVVENTAQEKFRGVSHAFLSNPNVLEKFTPTNSA